MRDELLYNVAAVWYFIFCRKHQKPLPFPLSKGHDLHISTLQEPFRLFKVNRSPALKQLVRNLTADKHLPVLCQEERTQCQIKDLALGKALESELGFTHCCKNQVQELL